MSFAPLTPTARLSDQLAQALREQIEGGALGVGAKLPTELALAAQFGVSRTVVREAVSRLKSVGLLESRQGSGVYVCERGMTPLQFDAGAARTRQTVVQIVEVRRALEAEVAALAAQRATAADRRRIRQAVRAVERAVRAGGDGVAEDVAYHRAVADAARNAYLNATLDFLRQFQHDATRITRANEARRADFAQQVREEHEAIVQAIEVGDSLAARQAAARHMDNAIARIEQADPGFWQEQSVALDAPKLASAR